MAHPTFTARRITPDTICIGGPGCDCYLLVGDNEALMIDSGMSDQNIRAFAQSLTDKPLRAVINTHSHFDHTAQNGAFNVVYGTPGIARGAKNIMDCPPLDYPLDYEFTFVNDGDVIDLGDRPLRVIVLDCHAPGNLARLDETRRMLFPGDELESGQVLLLPGYAEEIGQIHSKPAASVETYLHAMKKLDSFSDQFDMILPSHNGTPIDKGYLADYIALSEAILRGEIEGSRECSSPSYSKIDLHFPHWRANYRRAELHGASLVYCRDLVFDKDYANADALPPATNLHLVSSQNARQ